MNNLTIGNIIAVLGLVIASISLGWNILNELRKTPRAKVYLMIAKFVQQGNPVSLKDDIFLITISNIGERPILIKGIASYGYKWWWHPFKKITHIIVPRKLPIYLKDGEDHYEQFIYTPEQFKELLDNCLQRICVWDSMGQYHWASRKDMFHFKKQIRNLLKRKNLTMRST